MKNPYPDNLDLCIHCKKVWATHVWPGDDCYPACNPPIRATELRLWGDVQILKIFEPMSNLQYIEYQYSLKPTDE